MGIKNLSKLLSRVAAAARRETQLSDYANHRFAIDVPIYMWKFCSVTCGHPLRCFEEQLLEFGRHNIQPIYVFDGAAVACKENEIARRREVRASTRDAMTTAQTEYRDMCERGGSTRAYHRDLATARQKYEKLRRRVASMPSRRHYDALRELLQVKGIESVESGGDAECRCAQLVGEGRADCVVTDDYDAIPYLCGLAEGKGKMLFGINRPNILEIDVAKVLELTEMSRSEFVDVCILSGCDFCDKIQGVACNRAFQLVREHGSIEAILECLDTRYTAPDPFDFDSARIQFGITSSM